MQVTHFVPEVTKPRVVTSWSRYNVSLAARVGGACLLNSSLCLKQKQRQAVNRCTGEVELTAKAFGRLLLCHHWGLQLPALNCDVPRTMPPPARATPGGPHPSCWPPPVPALAAGCQRSATTCS